MTSAATSAQSRKWSHAWPDGLAFAGGLAVAGFSGWQTTDLVWSLWLASLVVGSATIVWSLFSPGLFIGVLAWRDGAFARRESAVAVLVTAVVLCIGALFMLAFFTVHFGMFHYVHSVFLQSFFPITLTSGEKLEPSKELYFVVVSSYWMFLPVSFLAERQCFRLPAQTTQPPDTSVKAADIAARKARNSLKGMSGMMAPYQNVIRLHVLIFFFALAHFANLENYFVYAVVYAAYFFPWRLVRKNIA